MIATRALVHALVRDDGTVAADELHAVAATLGMTDQQVRLCVKRLVTEGRFTREGRGRAAVLRATAEVSDDLEFAKYAYQQDHGLAPWDGRWRLVGFAVPESARAARDRFRDAVAYLGGAPLHGGLYVSPNDWHDLVRRQADQLRITDCVTTLTSTDLSLGDDRDPRRLAAKLWPLRDLADAYTRLAEHAREHTAALDGPRDHVELLADAIALATEFTDVMRPDPLLPPELLPQPWPGTDARARFARYFADLSQHHTDATRIRLFQRYGSLSTAGPGSQRTDTAGPLAGHVGQWPSPMRPDACREVSWVMK